MSYIEENKDATYYFIGDKLHRENGPAIEFANGDKVWYKNGKRHREDGPAIEYNAYHKRWYLNDKCYGLNNDFTNESWERFVKL